MSCYNLKNIRALLTEGFTDEELRALCFDVFKPVFHKLAQNMGKVEIVGRLLEYADQTLQIDKLLTLAKAHNPARYEEHKPYTIDVEVFISYANRDRNRVLEIAGHLEAAGVKIWLDRNEIRQKYSKEVVCAIKGCKILILMCSDASMRSMNVKQELQIAWKYERPYLPLLLEPTSFPEQLMYWLEGWQGIEVLTFPSEQWLPPVLQVLGHIGVQCQDMDLSQVQAKSVSRPIRLAQGLEGLRVVARFTNQIWPLPIDRIQRDVTSSTTRGLGAPQNDVQHGYRLGSRVCLAIESDLEGHLLLLDEGPEGIIYCLCPSWFAPKTRLRSGRSYLPQEGSYYDSFVVTGKPGREHLLAIITDKPLELDWMPKDPKIPAHVLTAADVGMLLTRLQDMDGDSWIALSTYFDVIA
jgi:hypothetical protein